MASVGDYIQIEEAGVVDDMRMEEAAVTAAEATVGDDIQIVEVTAMEAEAMVVAENHC